MKNNFDLNRLGMVIRWDVLNSWTHNLGVIAGLAICFSITNIIRLYKISGFIAASHELDAMTDSYLKSAYMFFGFISFMVIYVLASCIFRNMKTKLQRESFLMLPATNLEKYAARFLVVTVGGLVTLLGALVISDIIQLIFSIFITPGFHISLTWPVLSHTISPIGNSWQTILVGCSFLIFAHSFATLGGSFYRKLPVLLTACTGLALCLIFAYIVNELGEAGWRDFVGTLHIEEGSSAQYCAVFTSSAVFLALAAFNYWASYKLFTRMQVICNKWINI